MGVKPNAITVRGVELEAFYQRYFFSSEPDRIAGEILTRPDGIVDIERFFSSLGLDECMRILDWQFAITETLADACGAHCSVNVHNSVLASGHRRGRLTELIASQVTPMTLEFTESYPMPSSDVSNAFLREIRDLGHTSALDDYGSGADSRDLLNDFDFDIIKIDRSLVLGLDSSPGMQREIGRIATLLAGLGKGHVVEGVETIEVFDLLEVAGFTTFQGYLFRPPVPVSEMLLTP
jgi:EAL domain-containing protein (putative c-di-GMP-specific phosphodiesterase class I)